LSGRGVDTAFFNSDIEGARRLCFVGQDYYRSGRVAGSLMRAVLRGPATIAVATGYKGITSHLQRVEGFLSYISEHCPELRVAEVLECYDNPQTARRAARRLFEEHPNVQGLCVMTYGAEVFADRVAKLGLKGRVRIVTFDASDVKIRLLKDGAIDFVIGQNPGFQTHKAIEILFQRHTMRKEPGADRFITDISVTTDEFYPDK
jgi:LacI family transcriptional regulator